MARRDRGVCRRAFLRSLQHARNLTHRVEDLLTMPMYKVALTREVLNETAVRDVPLAPESDY